MGAGAGSRGRGDQGAARVTLRRRLWTGDGKGKGLGKAPRETRSRFQREGVTAAAWCLLMEGWAQQAGRQGLGWWEGFGGALGASPPVQERTVVCSRKRSGALEVTGDHLRLRVSSD